eukprot:8400242-Ditylum_brightwellii.AAC.1
MCLRHIFRALLTGSNPDFNQYVKNKKDAFDKRKHVNVAELLQDVKKKHVNMKDKFNDIDPKDAKIIALTTKLADMEKKIDSSNGGGAGGNNNGGGNRFGNNGPPTWKTTFKGNNITHNGSEWEWCAEHKKE